jgi:hypothetical protein
MFFQNRTNMDRLGKNRDAVMKLTGGKSESETVDLIFYKLNSLYGDDGIIGSFLTFMRKHRKEMFLYLKNPKVEKTSDLAEQHFSIQ